MSNSYSVVGGIGNAVAAEKELTFRPREMSADAKPGILYLHGSSAHYSAFSKGATYSTSKMAALITLAGIPGVAIEMGGSLYANDVAIADCVDSLDWFASALRRTGNKVFVLGVSMGGGTALRFAIEHPDLCAGVIAMLPMTNIQRLVDENILGLRTAVCTAWGVTYPTPLPADANLLAQAHIIADNNIPVQIWYDEADTVVNYHDIEAMGAAVGATMYQIDPEDPGHTESAITWAVDHGEGRASTIIDFLRANGA